MEEKNKGMKFDEEKLRYDLIPTVAEEELAKVLTYGARKYMPNSWQLLENFKNRYYAAARRHLTAYRDGEHLDPESGLSHLSHALTCLAFLVWEEHQENLDWSAENRGKIPAPDPEQLKIWDQKKGKDPGSL